MERFTALCTLARKIIKEVTEVDEANDTPHDKNFKKYLHNELESEFDVKALNKPKACGRIRKKAPFSALSAAQKDMVIGVLADGIEKVKSKNALSGFLLYTLYYTLLVNRGHG